MIDLEAIKAREKAASPGPWEKAHKWSYTDEPPRRLVADLDSDQVIAQGEGRCRPFGRRRQGRPAGDSTRGERDAGMGGRYFYRNHVRCLAICVGGV